MARQARRPVVEAFATGDNLRWDVRWVVKKHGEWHIVVKEFGTDLPEANRLYWKVKALGRHYVTLRCRNSGFPPPKALRPYWHKKKIKTLVPGTKRVRGKRVKFVKTVVSYKDVYRSPLRKKNREGVWWCPYCMEMREFVAPYELPFTHPPVPALRGLDPHPTEAGLYCPMCLVGTRDHAVRKWNPLAERIT